jgi:carboxypeptidase D
MPQRMSDIDDGVLQPVGTGFSQGTPNITGEYELADQVHGFLLEFFDIFSKLQGKKFWVTGKPCSALLCGYF